MNKNKSCPSKRLIKYTDLAEVINKALKRRQSQIILQITEKIQLWIYEDICKNKEIPPTPHQPSVLSLAWFRWFFLQPSLWSITPTWERCLRWPVSYISDQSSQPAFSTSCFQQVWFLLSLACLLSACLLSLTKRVRFCFLKGD